MATYTLEIRDHSRDFLLRSFTCTLIAHNVSLPSGSASSVPGRIAAVFFQRPESHGCEFAPPVELMATPRVYT